MDIATINLIHQKLQILAIDLNLDVGITDLAIDQQRLLNLQQWLDNDMNGSMEYMRKNLHIRHDPRLLLDSACRVIMCRLNYSNLDKQQLQQEQQNLYNYADDIDNSANISIYARGRDYHKVLRQQINKLAIELHNYINNLNITDCTFMYRIFTDSAPIMEIEFAQKSGLGWRGKHSLLLNKNAGSLFFLGGMLINIPLPINNINLITQNNKGGCGTCSRCIQVCPTKAIIAPYIVDARRCISYLTIEHEGSIPIELRPLIGKHVYGCDECQLVCPWNKFVQKSLMVDFLDREYSNNILNLWNWGEDKFLNCMQGSAIRRIGYEKWQRNLAVVIGNYIDYQVKLINCNYENSQQLAQLKQALIIAREISTPMVQEHIDWSLGKYNSNI